MCTTCQVSPKATDTNLKRAGAIKVLPALAAPIVVAGTALEPGLPTALFQPRIALGGAAVSGRRQQYDVAPDGRFLINVNTADATAAPITVIEHWNPEAKK